MMPRPRRLPLVIGLSLALLVLGLLGYVTLSRAQAEPLEVYGTAPAFTLTDQYERSVSAADLRGKAVVANFIYTHCPDICPTLSLQMQALQARLRQEGLLGREVQLLSFTVDPARDTPAVLRAYAERHQADPEAWRFLTGAEEVVTPVIVQGFYQAVQPLRTPAAASAEHDHDMPGKPAYEVMHSGRFVLIDRQGRIRAFYSGSEFDVEQVVRDLRAVLGE